jgi:multiple sugar transport system substrate-binding protein
MSTMHTPTFDRRTALRGLIAAAGLAAVPGLAACSGNGGSGSESSSTVSFGSNAAVPQPKGAYETVFAAAKKATGLTVDVNWVDHNTFQNNITTYLQGNPQDVFNWFAGERMQFFASQGLCGQVDAVWDVIGSNYTAAMKAQSKGTDGHYYFVPFDYYPWAVYYRKSLWAAKGYTAPTTWDEFIALAKKMKGDGLVPLAFTDKDEWPAMGTFDYLNLRMNGYDFHINLMRTGQDWNSPQVLNVFKQWAELLPYYSPGAAGLTWQEGVTQLVNKTAGMMVLGLDQIGTIFNGQGGNPPADDLGFFGFPTLGTQYDAENVVEAPIDGFMTAAKPKNQQGANKLLEYLGTATAQQIWLATDPADIATASGVDTSKYTTAQTASSKFITGAGHLSQFLDRDTRADFGDPIVGPAILSWLSDPGSASSVCNSLAQQAKSIWATAG